MRLRTGKGFRMGSRRRWLCVLLMLVSIPGCREECQGGKEEVAGDARELGEVESRRRWFNLGGSVHHAGDRFEWQEACLKFVSYPEWFVDPQKDLESGDLSKYRDSFALSNDLEGLSRRSEGGRLQFGILPGERTEELIFELTLSADRRDLSREVEHRYTNVLPFLFSFEQEGRLVQGEKPEASGRMGGIRSTHTLAPVGESHTWKVRVDVESLENLLEEGDCQVEVLACFGERQHELEGLNAIGSSMFESELNIPTIETGVPLKARPTAALVLSNPVTLIREEGRWMIKP